MSETADDRFEGPVDHEAIRAAVRETGMVATDAAKQSGVAYSTLSAFMNGKYAGDNDKVARALTTWLESRSAGARTRALMPSKPKFVKTPTADAILAAMEHAQYIQDLVVISGGAGVGKTTACEHYQRNNPNVWLATAEPSLSSTHAMLEYLCEVIGIAEKAPNRRSRSIVLRVKGSGGLLIVDEAQHLKSEALDQLRTLHDKGEIGVALVGNEQVYARLEGGSRRPEFAQLFSRVGMRVSRARPLAKDIEVILDAAGVTGNEERRLLRAVAKKPGALRGLQKCLRVAHMIANGAGAESVDAGHIQAAWSKLADTAPLEGEQ